jgi:hypothetical protein
MDSSNKSILLGATVIATLVGFSYFTKKDYNESVQNCRDIGHDAALHRRSEFYEKAFLQCMEYKYKNRLL